MPSLVWMSTTSPLREKPNTRSSYATIPNMLPNDDGDDAFVFSLSREEFITDSQGHSQWALVTKIPVFDAKGAATGMVGITRDITRQKKADEALATERNLLRTVIDNLAGSG